MELVFSQLQQRRSAAVPEIIIHGNGAAAGERITH
jgi:hypothetical protein